MTLVPFVIESTGRGERSYDIYSRMLQDRIIFLTGEITDAVANTVISQLLYLDAIDSDKEIKLYIHSPGGSISAGLGIYDAMQYIKSDVSTLGIGLAASMGAFLLASGTRGRRFGLRHSEIMIHQPLGEARGQSTDIEIRANRMLKMRHKLNVILANHTGQPIDQIQQDTDRDFFMSAEEAVHYGLIDRILTNET
ncbi:ATP-dependent Clp protease proteolytic subunit [Paenibacillus sp. N3.4]|uniref:ATP-dependent Clp protease proteolytic subunit n=1 Tax=Paenibacillus sp. N3.4 TaxID=2603222 RepID=UPI0011CBCFCC|nr:ATP-dependent Clp protease proteolytic subunit [Paenibacillus sp. N3.4]TXK85261.1 ATP-dependent Clp protease proteolytic subunit [Paenibacillus sp. N3.4]